MNAATTVLPDATTYRWRRRRRILRALLLAIGSGGVLWWRAARVVLAVARRAPSMPPPTGAAIVVPGFRLNVDELQAPYAARLRHALQLWRRQPEQPLLVSGTAFAADALSEAQAGMLFLRDLGLPARAPLILDHQARDTEENLRRTVALLGRPDNGITLVTNRWHLARCAWLARRVGLDVALAAAETHWRDSAYGRLAVAREALSLLSFAGPAASAIDPDQLLEPHR